MTQASGVGRLSEQVAALEQRQKGTDSKINRLFVKLAGRNEGAKELGRILRRSLVGDALTYIEERAGARQFSAEGRQESWGAYFLRQSQAGGEYWMIDLGVPIYCVGLLLKGPHTTCQPDPYPAHNLRTLRPDVFRAIYLKGTPEDTQGPWEELYAFLEKQNQAELPRSQVRQHCGSSLQR